MIILILVKYLKFLNNQYFSIIFYIKLYYNISLKINANTYLKLTVIYPNLQRFVIEFKFNTSFAVTYNVMRYTEILLFEATSSVFN